jgi:hypothetical protein
MHSAFLEMKYAEGEIHIRIMPSFYILRSRNAKTMSYVSSIILYLGNGLRWKLESLYLEHVVGPE